MIGVSRNGLKTHFGGPKEQIDLCVGHLLLAPTLDELWDFWEVLRAAARCPDKTFEWSQYRVRLRVENRKILHLDVGNGQSVWQSCCTPRQLSQAVDLFEEICERVEPYEVDELYRAVSIPMALIEPKKTTAPFRAAWSFLIWLGVASDPLPRRPEKEINKLFRVRGYRTPRHRRKKA